MTEPERACVLQVHHDVGNALAIARANLEALSDGVLTFSPETIERLLESLDRAARALDELGGLTAADQ